MTIREMRRRAPYRLDYFIAYSGAAYRRAAPSGKTLARAYGLDRSRGIRYRAGDVNAPFTHALVALAEAEQTCAWPLLIEGMVTVTQTEIRTASDDDLTARRLELEDIE